MEDDNDIERMKLVEKYKRRDREFERNLKKSQQLNNNLWYAYVGALFGMLIMWAIFDQ